MADVITGALWMAGYYVSVCTLLAGMFGVQWYFGGEGRCHSASSVNSGKRNRKGGSSPHEQVV